MEKTVFFTDTPTAKAPKSIDIYLIAGQSNAVGCTRMTSVDEIYSFAPEIKDGGFTNVHYAGSSRTGGDPFVNNEKEWQSPNIGFGMNENSMGPEIGLAKALSEYYNKETGRHAGLIKFGHGGSSVRNIFSGENATGNWVSPSYAKELGADDARTGSFYRGLLEQVKRNISELEAYGGFTDINIVGLYWMQGETDRSATEEYEKAFKFLVSDLRADLTKIMLEFTNGVSDCGASHIPVVIGSISRSFCLTNPLIERHLNMPFIGLQKKLSEEIENCYFLDNSNYPITRWNAETSSVEVIGTDTSHWNQSDMLKIGHDLGRLFINEIVTAKKK